MLLLNNQKQIVEWTNECANLLLLQDKIVITFQQYYFIKWEAMKIILLKFCIIPPKTLYLKTTISEFVFTNPKHSHLFSAMLAPISIPAPSIPLLLVCLAYTVHRSVDPHPPSQQANAKTLSTVAFASEQLGVFSPIQCTNNICTFNKCGFHFGRES